MNNKLVRYVFKTSHDTRMFLLLPEILFFEHVRKFPNNNFYVELIEDPYGPYKTYNVKFINKKTNKEILL